MRLVIRKPARADLDGIFLHVAIERLVAAERLIDRLMDAISGLRDFPKAGQPSSGDRRELVTVQPCVILYRVG